MKKMLLVSTIVILIFAVAASATETRVLTMGDANMIVKDENNIWLFPSTINMYPNLILGEVGTWTTYQYDPYYEDYDQSMQTDLYRVGGHYSFGEDRGIVGLYFDKKGLMIDPDIQPDPGWDMSTDQRINLFYGRPLMDIDFGLAFSLYRDSYSVEESGDSLNVPEETEESNTGWGLALGATLLEDKLDLAVGISKVSWTYKDWEGKDVTEPESNTSFGFNARYWYNFNDEVDFVPHLGVQFLSFGYTFPADSSEEVYWSSKGTDKMTTIDLGCGWNLRPQERILLVGDVGVAFISEKYEDETTYYLMEPFEPDTTYSYEWKYSDNYLPYFRLGLEGEVAKWWDVRLGVVKRWVGSKMEYPADWDWENQNRTVKEGYATTDTYLGSGFHFGNLDLDIWLDPAFVLNGPNFVSGKSYDESNLASMASIKYTW